MRFKLHIDTDNDAFSDESSTEIARILRDLADDLDGTGEIGEDYSEKLRDYNGNTVGRASVTDSNTSAPTTTRGRG
jgi:hypothetical protein